MAEQPGQSSVEWRVIEGDCREALLNLPAQSVQTCVTSPPYFGLRDYGHDGQIGLEPTPDEFVAALVAVFREVRRVLRDDGTLWLNLGDSYAGSWGAQSHRETPAVISRNSIRNHPKRAQRTGSIPAGAGYKAKDLLGIPWMVAFALRADGWFLRSDIIWAKPNPMPESVTDRPTKAHEYLFLLSKGPRYFYDADAIREGAVAADDYARRSNPGPTGRGQQAWTNGSGTAQQDHSGWIGGDGVGRNRRSVWTVATQPYAGAHFATFPPKLIEPCILAGSPEQACSACGAPWRRIVERTPMVVTPTPKRAEWQASDDHARTQTGGTMTQAPTSRTVGFEHSCQCDAPPGPSTVLDPFAGSGTTGVVALRRNRSFVGCELNRAYAEMARDRIRDDAPLLNVGAEAA